MQCMVGMGSNCPPPPSNPFIAALTANPLTGSILTDIGMAQNIYNGDYYAAGQTTGNAAAQAAVVVAGLGAGSAIGVIADTFSDATAAADLTAAAAETPDAIGGAGAEVSAAQPAGAEVPSGGCSFTPDTQVATAAGSISIASLKVGDTVMAYDPKTGQTRSHTVTAVMSHTDAVVEHLGLDSGPIETTPNHPFFTADRGWVVAGSLTIGEQIRTESGRNATVVAFTLDSTPSTMWDLTVDGAHTFFVGPAAVLVHNCNEVPFGQSADDGFNNVDWLAQMQRDLLVGGSPETVVDLNPGSLPVGMQWLWRGIGAAYIVAPAANAAAGFSIEGDRPELPGPNPCGWNQTCVVRK
jgi:hypothetical protein